MNCYGSLAQWYNSLTMDIPYRDFADYYESVFKADGGDYSLLLDLCCGTGTLSCEMAKRGYEMICTDASPDMLMQAQVAAHTSDVSLLLLCQNAADLDLYGTVDACYSSLDSINYLSPHDLEKTFKRLFLFIRPGGLLIFDIRSIQWLQSMDGETYVDETDNVLCLWRADFNKKTLKMTYGIDLFSRKGKLWERSSEYHTEYAYSEEKLTGMLLSAGFKNIQIKSDGPQGKLGRLFVIAKRH